MQSLAESLRRQWHILLTVAAAVILISWIYAATQPKRYRATAIAAVTPLTAELTATDVLRGIEGLDRRVVVATVAALATAPSTLEAAAAGDYAIRAAVLPNTNLFRVEVTGENPARTAEIANAIPSLLAAQTRAMYRLYGVSLISQAAPPAVSVGPRLGRAVALGMLLGILAGVGAAYVVDERRGRS